jgi:hypothetical protein
MSERPGASPASLPAHLLRGAIGLGCLAGALLLFPGLGAVALLLAAPGLVALRGCPMCWLVGLVDRLAGGSFIGDCCRVRSAVRTGSRAARISPTGKADSY